MSNIVCSTFVNISNEILCHNKTYCLREGEKVHCKDETFDVKESPLTYKDTMFWVFLGVYVALVLFAGKKVLCSYLLCVFFICCNY